MVLVSDAITFVSLVARRPVRDLDRAEPLERFRNCRDDPSENRHFAVFRPTSLGHFIRGEEMSAMLPPAVRYRVE